MADEYFLETAFPQIPEFHFLMMEEDVKASLIKEQEMYFSWYPDVTDTKQYKCDTCTYATSDRSNFTKHLRVHTGGKPYGCYACDYKTDRRYLLNEHVRIHTGEKPFKCDLCAYATKDRSNLSKHLRTHTGERPYRCKLCNYSTGNRFSLKSHMRTHTGRSSAPGLTRGESSKDYDDSE
uniref:Zinc finger and SCAN domain-containing protein 22 n=1 Tax=Lygus hesperus TaxID=30085 RepID=A0A146MHG6_LYGHE